MKLSQKETLSDEGIGDLLDEDPTVPLIEGYHVVPTRADVTPEPSAHGVVTDNSSFPGPCPRQRTQYLGSSRLLLTI